MSRRKNIIIVGLSIFIIWTIFSILSSSKISISRFDNSEIVLGAEFPNAECTKIFKRDFPFFEFKCTKLANQDKDDKSIEADDKDNENNENIDGDNR